MSFIIAGEYKNGEFYSFECLDKENCQKAEEIIKRLVREFQIEAVEKALRIVRKLMRSSQYLEIIQLTSAQVLDENRCECGEPDKNKFHLCPRHVILD